MNKAAPKVLLFDIETAPIVANVWSIWEQNVGLNQIQKDWAVLAWSAKWLGAKKVFYEDVRHQRDKYNDKKLLKGIWKLLNEADIVITQNGKRFDAKKLNARFAIHGMGPPSPYQHIDTHQLARKHFGFTSNKLEYLTDKLCTKYKKLKHHEFSGFELWKQCLAGNQKAWAVMEKYNKYDVLSLEELYTKLMPWGTGVSMGSLSGVSCSGCGSSRVQSRGQVRSKQSVYQRYQCQDCGTWLRSGENQVPHKKRLLRGI